MGKIWAKLNYLQKRTLVWTATFVVASVSILLIDHKILFPGIIFASFALPAVPLLSDSITNNIGDTGVAIYEAIFCAIFAATFAAPIISYKLRLLRNIAITPFIIFGLIFGIMALSGGGFIGPA